MRIEPDNPSRLNQRMIRSDTSVDQPNILESLVYMREEVIVDPEMAAKARLAVERMVNLKTN